MASKRQVIVITHKPPAFNCITGSEAKWYYGVGIMYNVARLSVTLTNLGFALVTAAGGRIIDSMPDRSATLNQYIELVN